MTTPTEIERSPARLAVKRRISPLAKAAIALAVLVGGAVCWVIALLVVEPGAILPMHTARLPGMQVDLPGGRVDRSTAKDYPLGSFTLDSVIAPVTVILAWEPGPLPDEDTMKRLLDSVARAFGKADHREAVVVANPEGLPARSWHLRTSDGGAIWATFIACGGRQIRIIGGTRRGSGERLHRRMVGSFHCRPDPEQEASIGDLPVTFALPPGWSELPHESGQVMLTDGKWLLVARAMSGRPTDDAIGAILRGGLALGPHSEVGAREGSDWPCRVKVGRLPMQGWLTFTYCPDRHKTLLVMALGADPNESAAVKALLPQARCRGLGEAAQVWPRFNARGARP
jgi:hypothetical protein